MTLRINNLSVGLIGVGVMGNAIAMHLKRDRFLKAVYDIKDDSTNPNYLPNSVQNIMKYCNIIMICLPSIRAVEDTINLLLKNSKKDMIILDLSTISPALARQNFQRCQERGMHYIEAPMIGGVRSVQHKKLKILVSGNKEVLTGLSILFSSFTKEVISVKTIGMANCMKLIHNVITLGNALVSIEALSIGQSLGLDLRLMFRIIGKGTASSYVMKNTLKRTLLYNNYGPGFKLRLASKDLMLAADLIEQVEMKPYILERIISLFEEANLDSDLREIEYPVIQRVLEKKIYKRPLRKDE